MGKWETVRLGDVCDVRDGTHDSPKYVNSGYPLITSKNVTKGYLDFSNVNLISFQDYKEINKRSKVDVGDIIMPMIGTIGQPIIIKMIEQPFAIKNVALVKFNNNKVYNVFVKDILKSVIFNKYIDQLSRGGTQKFIALKDIRSFSFPLPPLPIQQKIADILDQASALIEKRKKQIAKLDLLVKSQFIEMFGDPVMNSKDMPIMPLGELCSIYRGGSPRPIDQYLGGTIPWIKIGDATGGDNIYLHSTKDFIIENGIKKSRFVKAGSLIFANCGVSLGFARIITFNGCIHDGWLSFEDIDEQLNKEFLLMSLNHCTAYFRDTAPDGTQPNLNTGIMKSFQQILPPLALQNRFADFVKQVDKSKSEMQQGLEKLELLYKSLMQKCFRGELF